MGENTLISLLLGVLLVVGLFVAAKVVFLGTMIFAGIWVICRRLPGFHWLAAHVPVVIDGAATVGAFVLLLVLGISSTTTFLACAVTGLEMSMWVALTRQRYLSQQAGGAQVVG